MIDKKRLIEVAFPLQKTLLGLSYQGNIPRTKEAPYGDPDGTAIHLQLTGLIIF